MASLNELYSLPEISMLKDEGITLESIQQEMIADFEIDYEEQTGESLTLYPADPWRMMINAASAKFYQAFAIADARQKQNFLAYMTIDSTRQWGGNFGFLDNGEENASCVVRFSVSAVQEETISIPAGTEVTAGDGMFFATVADAMIEAGEEYIDLRCVCTEPGAAANGKSIGTVNILSNPINYIGSVSNITATSGGRDAYTNDELKEKIMNFPDTYSVAGPKGAYEQMAYAYSSAIVSAQATATTGGIVTLYIMLSDAELPSGEYCAAVKEYFTELGRFPDTDQLVVKAPEKVEYEVNAKYYISEYSKEVETTIKVAVEAAVREFADATAGEIGKAIVPDDLTSYVKAAGARRIEITSPSYETVGEGQIAICKSISLEYGGLEED